MTDRPRPLPTVETRPFWDGLAERELRLRWCPGCERFDHPRTAVCPRCLAATEWRAVSGHGSLRTWTVMRRPFVPGFEPPYVVAVVAPQEAPEVELDVALASPASDLAVGLEVEIAFIDDDRGFTSCEFRKRTPSSR
jgi:uncharacterized OB-fold protein